MKIAIVGATGAVGQELLKLLQNSNAELVLFDSKSSITFRGIDLAFFCVESALAKQLIPLALQSGTLCIDSSTAYRSDPNVPLVIPEINGHALQRHQGVIASPNCTTTIMLMPLAPLHRKFQIKRIVAATYQAVSGAGVKGIGELEKQTRSYLEKKELAPEVFPYSCAFNVFPHESTMGPHGYVAEEMKMHEESRKILEDETIGVTATCVRVPVFRVHSIAANVEFASPFEKTEAISLIANAPGVRWNNNPTPLDAALQEDVFCGRVRMDHTQPNTLEIWAVGDQLLKGAALNMFQIAEKLCLK